jgi:hypothetical protein
MAVTGDGCKGGTHQESKGDNMSLELPSKWPGLVATAKAEKQEPDDLTIAYMSGLHDGKKKRTWVGLTDEEIDKAWRSVDHTIPYAQFRIDVAKAIEAKLKEKNT